MNDARATHQYHFEDFTVGRRFDCAPHKMTREEIVSFAREFDPQPFHVDEAAAKGSFFGGLVASGWHTASVVMRAVSDGFLLRTAGLGSPGIDELKWLRPVLADDVLSIRAEVIERKESRSKPDMGLVRFRMEARNQRDEPVMTQENWIMIARRPADAQD